MYYEFMKRPSTPSSDDQFSQLLSIYASINHSHSVDNVSGLQEQLEGKAAVSHAHTAAQVTDFSEAVDDRVAALLVAGSNVTLTYNDASNTLTIAATGGGGGNSYFP